MIIAISGNVGSGKTTVGKMFEYILSFLFQYNEEFIPDYELYSLDIPNPDVNIKRLSFATPLKQVATILTGENLIEFYDQRFKTRDSNYTIDGKALTNRELLNYLGTIFRKDNSNIFVDLLFNNIKDNDDITIIDDLRFENEYHAIRSYKDSIVIRLNTIKEPQGIVYPLDNNDNNVFKFDYILDEYKKPKELFEWVKDIALEITKQSCRL